MVREGLAATLLAAICAAAVPGCAEPVTPAPPAAPPATPRQFRGAWVATVANIDWPSKKGLTSAEQRAEILAIVDRAQALGLNALVLQVRPSADAIYPSALEPWTEFVDGPNGAAPDYDPLAMWVAEAHRRGIELHAWFNPYRARHKDAKDPIASNHVSVLHPEIVKSYGGYLWLDPGEPASADLTLSVILDVVRRYDVDGVHIDDYFYPYPEGGVDFPDDASWSRYTGTLSRADWRRKNVSDLIARIYAGVHSIKSWVKFGISPFGLGRPDRRPPGVTGFSQYDQLYADVETWLEQGWLDYLAPQLYWPRTHKIRPFALMLDSWMKADTSHRHVWPGLDTSAFDRDEIRYETELAPNGHIHFSMKALLDSRSIYDAPAIIPATPWLSAPATEPPILQVESSATVHIALFAKNAATYPVWSRRGGRWELAVVPAAQAELTLDRSVDAIEASAVDRVGNESARVRWSRK